MKTEKSKVVQSFIALSIRPSGGIIVAKPQSTEAAALKALRDEKTKAGITPKPKKSVRS